MKKTMLSTAISLILMSSANVMAEDDSDWENILDEASSEIEGINVDEILASDDFGNLLLSDELAILPDEISKEKEIFSEDEKNADPSVIIKAEAEAEAENVKEIEHANVLVTEEKEDVVDSKPISIKSNVLSTNPDDLNFLRYVPEGTRFTINNTFKVLPKKKFIIMHEGERVLSNPQSKLDPEKTFCYIQLKPSGKARILRSGKEFVVTSVKAREYDTEVVKSYGNYNLKTYKVDFKVDNQNVVMLSCYSAKMFKLTDNEKPVPLLIKDMKEQMGKIIKIDYAAYEEI